MPKWTRRIRRKRFVTTRVMGRVLKDWVVTNIRLARGNATMSRGPVTTEVETTDTPVPVDKTVGRAAAAVTVVTIKVETATDPKGAMDHKAGTTKVTTGPPMTHTDATVVVAVVVIANNHLTVVVTKAIAATIATIIIIKAITTNRRVGATTTTVRDKISSSGDNGATIATATTTTTTATTEVVVVIAIKRYTAELLLLVVCRVVASMNCVVRCIPLFNQHGLYFIAWSWCRDLSTCLKFVSMVKPRR